MAYSEKLNLIYINIPVNGGDIIKEKMKLKDFSTDINDVTWKYYDVYPIRLVDPMSFTIVRNPWDRVYDYFSNTTHKDFKDFVLSLKSNKILGDQYPFIKDNEGYSKVKQILRYEFINEVFGWLNDVYGLGLSEISTKYSDYKNHYDSETISIVSDLYTEDIQKFNYGFG